MNHCALASTVVELSLLLPKFYQFRVLLISSHRPAVSFIYRQLHQQVTHCAGRYKGMQCPLVTLWMVWIHVISASCSPARRAARPTNSHNGQTSVLALLASESRLAMAPPCGLLKPRCLNTGALSCSTAHALSESLNSHFGGGNNHNDRLHPGSAWLSDVTPGHTPLRNTCTKQHP